MNTNTVSEDELSKFLARVDQVGECNLVCMKCNLSNAYPCYIGDLVKDLVTSNDHASSARAVEKADKYIRSPDTDGVTKTTQDRMLINKSQPSSGGKETAGVPVGGATGNSDGEQAAFLRTLEEDARERGERRKEREKKGKEAKKKGNQAFKEGNLERAVEWFTEGIKEAPWDITLYTNRALVSSELVCLPPCHGFGVRCKVVGKVRSCLPVR